MKKKLLVLIAIFVLLLASCNKTTEKTTENVPDVSEAEKIEEKDDSSHYPVTIVNYNHGGEEVVQVYDKKPEKVITVYQSPIDNLLALGVEDVVIGASYLDVEVKDEYKEAFEKIKYFDTAPSKEAILEMEPDMILSWYSYFGEKNIGDVDFWNDRDIHTYIIQNSGIKDPNTIEYEYEDIINLGKIFNKEKRAIEIVEDMKKDINTAKEYASGKDSVRTVILEIGKENSFRNYGKNSIGGAIAVEAGADLIIPENGSYNMEIVAEENPEVLFTVYYGDSILKDEAVSEILNNPSLQSIDAVKNNRVYAIMLSEVYAPGVRMADGIKSIIAGLYPEI